MKMYLLVMDKQDCYFKGSQDVLVIENKLLYSFEHLQRIWLKRIAPPVGIEPNVSHILDEHPNH